MAVATLEASLYQGQIFLADRTCKGTSRNKALEFRFEVCIHSFSLAKKGLDSKCIQSSF